MRLFGLGRRNKDAAAAPLTTQQYQQRMDARTSAADDKLRALDEEVARHKRQMEAVPHGSAAYRAARTRALQCLRRKRLYERQYDTYAQQSYRMEQVHFAQASMSDAREMHELNRRTGREMRASLRRMPDVDKMEAAMDELGDVMEDTSELQELLGRSSAYCIDGVDDMDEEELEGELDGLEADMLLGAEGDNDADDEAAEAAERSARSLPARNAAVAARRADAVAEHDRAAAAAAVPTATTSAATPNYLRDCASPSVPPSRNAAGERRERRPHRDRDDDADDADELQALRRSMAA